MGVKWRLNVAGGKSGSETEQRDRSRESENRQGSSGSQDGGNSMRQATNAVGYTQDYTPQSASRGNQMMMAGNYPAQDNGGGYGMYAPQGREMGFLAPLPDWEDRSGRRGGGTRSEEYSPGSGDVEARRRRSSRTGRFIRGEGDEGPEMHHRGRWDDDEDEMRRGSYRKHDEDGGQVERLHREIKKLKQRLEDSEEAQEHVQHLKREVKRLKEELEEMKGGKGGHGDEGREKKDKKKKDRGGEDSEDDEDDPGQELKKLLSGEVKGKEFLRFLPDIFRDAVQVIENPPDTWASYLNEQEYAGIYEMESKELLRAIREYRAGEGTLSDVLREAEHALASAVQLKAHLLQADLKHGAQE